MNTHFFNLNENNYIAIIPVEKAAESDSLKRYISKIPELLTTPHFSKVEFFPDFIYGSINIPEILEKGNAGLSFIYNSEGIVFIDKDGFVNESFNKVLELYREDITSPESGLYYILDFIISEDLEKMNAIQKNLVRLEQDILNNSTPEPIREITECRNHTMRLYHYYIQFAGLSSDLCNKSQVFFNEDSVILFRTLSEKINLFVHEARQIWEYTSQIRDVYQQQLDVHQNSIMKFLTIVTTIFMPLTLITGWYGMNFVYMPELHFKYSYPIIFGVSIVIVIILFVIFKKKKWW